MKITSTVNLRNWWKFACSPLGIAEICELGLGMVLRNWTVLKKCFRWSLMKLYIPNSRLSLTISSRVFSAFNSKYFVCVLSQTRTLSVSWSCLSVLRSFALSSSVVADVSFRFMRSFSTAGDPVESASTTVIEVPFERTHNDVGKLLLELGLLVLVIFVWMDAAAEIIPNSVPPASPSFLQLYWMY